MFELENVIDFILTFDQKNCIEHLVKVFEKLLN